MPKKANKILIKIFFAFTLIILLLVLWPGKTEKPPLPVQEAEEDKRLLMAYYDKGWEEETQGLPSFKEHYSSLDMLCPNWYGINSNGEVILSRGKLEPEIRELSFKEGVKILPLVTSQKGTYQVLASEELTKLAAENITNLVVKEDYAGINIDFEYISPEHSDNFIRLVKLISHKLRPENKVIAVSVFPKVEFPERLHGLHDYEKLAEYTDYICLMAYDRHSPETGPGPVAPYPWVEKNIEKALEVVPRKQLVLAIGAYGYDWGPGRNTEALGINQSIKRAEFHKTNISWDSESRVPYFTYHKNGNKHEVWFENERSAAIKAELAEKHELAGLTFWRLGFENKSYFNALLSAW